MGLLNKISGALFGSPDTGASQATYQRAQEMAEKAGFIFEDLDAPTQQQLLDSLKYLEDVPYEQAEQLGPSGMNVLSADPELVSQQKMALARLSEIGTEGLTPQEEFERSQLMRSISGSEQSRQKGIIQSAKERGVGGSGIEAAARLQSSQSAANRAAQEGQALEAEKYRRALEGITASGNLAGNIRSQDFSEGAAKASAADRIAEFNAAQRAGAQQRNLAQQRGIAAQKTTTGQQAYQNELEKKKAQAAAYSGAAQTASNQAAGQQQGALQEWSAGPQLFSTVLGAGAAAYGKACGGVVHKDKYKDGGIIQEGGKGYGDDVQVDVNEGEVVLNDRQLANIAGQDQILAPEQKEALFQSIDQNGAGPQDPAEEYAKSNPYGDYAQPIGIQEKVPSVKDLIEQEKGKSDEINLASIKQKNKQKLEKLMESYQESKNDKDVKKNNDIVKTREAGSPSLSKQNFADGGMVQPNTAEELLRQYTELDKKKEEDLNKAKWADLASSIGQGLAQYSTTKAFGEAGKQSGIYSQAPTLQQIKPESYEQLLSKYKNERLDLDKKTALLPKDLKSKPIKLGNELVDIDPKTGEYKAVYSGKDKNKPKIISNAKTGEVMEVFPGKINILREGQAIDNESPEASDNKSDISKAEQDYIIAAFSSIGATVKESDIRKLPAKYLRTNGQMMLRRAEKELSVKSLEERQKSVKLAEKKFTGLSAKQTRDYQEKFEDKITSGQDKIRTFLKHKTATEIVSNTPMLKAALAAAERGEETALAVLGVKMAKVMGERGMLSEADVTRYTNPVSLKGQILAGWQRYVNAKPTEDVAKSINNMTKSMETTSNALIDEAIIEQANNFSKSEGVPFEHAKYLMDYRIKSQNLSAPKEPVDGQKQDQREKMVSELKQAIISNPNIPKSDLWNEIVKKYRGR